MQRLQRVRGWLRAGSVALMVSVVPLQACQNLLEITDPDIILEADSPGAALASVAWLGMSGLYSLYVRFFSSYSSTYGALEGVIVLQLWFYFSSLVMLYAVELNVLLVQRRTR